MTGSEKFLREEEFGRKSAKEENETQVIDRSDLDELAELCKLRPWQRDRLSYWFSITFSTNK